MEAIAPIPKYTVSQGIRLLHLLRSGYDDTAIAAELVAPVAHVAHWIAQYKLAVYRQPELNQAEINTRAVALREAWRDKVAAEAKAISVDALGLVREKVEGGNAREFNDAARGLNTMVQLARQAEGMDSSAKGGDGSTINVWVLRVGEGGVEDLAAKRAERNVTPVPEEVSF